MDIGVLVRNITRFRHSLGDVDSERALELEVSFRDCGIDYSGALVSVTAV